MTPDRDQTITITGSGFGTLNPFDQGSKYLLVQNRTRSWRAGCESCRITLSVTSWSDSQIVLDGFRGDFGLQGLFSDWTLQLGDQLDIQVWNPQSGAGPASFGVTVGNRPTPASVTALEPASGSSAGGAVVTIRGQGLSNATGLTFGDVAAVFTVKSDTEITAIAPEVTDKMTRRPDLALRSDQIVVPVIVRTTAGLTAEHSTSLFTYQVPAPASTTDGPVITGISTVIPQAAQAFTITGRGFGTHAPYTGTSKFLVISDVTSNWRAGCEACRVTLRVLSWSDTKIEVGGFGGEYGSAWSLRQGDLLEVSVQNPNSVAGSARYSVRVGALPVGTVVTGLSPSVVRVEGGDQLAIRGKGLSGATSVRVGGVEAAIVSRSDNQLVVTVPFANRNMVLANYGGAALAVDVVVQTPAGTSATSPASKLSYMAMTGPIVPGGRVVDPDAAVTTADFVGMLAVVGKLPDAAFWAEYWNVLQKRPSDALMATPTAASTHAAHPLVLGAVDDQVFSIPLRQRLGFVPQMAPVTPDDAALWTALWLQVTENADWVITRQESEAQLLVSARTLMAALGFPVDGQARSKLPSQYVTRGEAAKLAAKLQEVTSKPVVSQRMPVVLIHGTGSSPSFWRNASVEAASRESVVAFLNQMGYREGVDLEVPQYPSLDGAIYGVERLKESVRAIQSRFRPSGVGHVQVMLTGHSLGGVVGRLYASLPHKAAIVQTLVTLAAPHQGFTNLGYEIAPEVAAGALAKWVCKSDLLIALVCIVGAETLTDTRDEIIVGGTVVNYLAHRPLPPGVRTLAIAGAPTPTAGKAPPLYDRTDSTVMTKHSFPGPMAASFVGVAIPKGTAVGALPVPTTLTVKLPSPQYDQFFGCAEGAVGEVQCIVMTNVIPPVGLSAAHHSPLVFHPFTKELLRLYLQSPNVRLPDSYQALVPRALQVGNGTLTGIIKDEQDKPLAGATIQILTPQFSPVASSVTGSDGVYVFRNVKPGVYFARVTRPGHALVTKQDVTMRSDGTTIFDTTLPVSGAAKSVRQGSIIEVSGRAIPSASIYLWLSPDGVGEVTYLGTVIASATGEWRTQAVVPGTFPVGSATLITGCSCEEEVYTQFKGYVVTR